MTSNIYSVSPVPMPHSVSPIYSQRLPSKRPISSYMTDIMSNKQTDIIPSPSPSPSSYTQDHSHALVISFLQYIGVLGILLLFIMLSLSIRFEMSKTKKKVKVNEGFNFHSEYPQQINPTAYNKLNLIRRASSNSLISENTSPV